MNADADIQVWLETHAVAQSRIIVPHVQSDTAQSLAYRIITTQEGPSGRSSIGQSGEIALKPDQAVALARMAINRNMNNACHVTLVITQPSRTTQRYEFTCMGAEKNIPGPG